MLSMANGASSAENSPDDNSDLGRTCTATRHRKCSSSQTAAQREEQLATERLWHILFFITSSYYTCTFPHTLFSSLFIRTFLHVSLLCYYSTFKFINSCMIGVRGMCLLIQSVHAEYRAQCSLVFFQLKYWQTSVALPAVYCTMKTWLITSKVSIVE